MLTVDDSGCASSMIVRICIAAIQEDGEDKKKRRRRRCDDDVMLRCNSDGFMGNAGAEKMKFKNGACPVLSVKEAHFLRTQ
jgi:hypothetical protein